MTTSDAVNSYVGSDALTKAFRCLGSREMIKQQCGFLFCDYVNHLDGQNEFLSIFAGERRVTDKRVLDIKGSKWDDCGTLAPMDLCESTPECTVPEVEYRNVVIGPQKFGCKHELDCDMKLVDATQMEQLICTGRAEDYVDSFDRIFLGLASKRVNTEVGLILEQMRTGNITHIADYDRGGKVAVTENLVNIPREDLSASNPWNVDETNPLDWLINHVCNATCCTPDEMIMNCNTFHTIARNPNIQSLFCCESLEDTMTQGYAGTLRTLNGIRIVIMNTKNVDCKSGDSQTILMDGEIIFRCNGAKFDRVSFEMESFVGCPANLCESKWNTKTYGDVVYSQTNTDPYSETIIYNSMMQVLPMNTQDFFYLKAY